MLVLLSCDCALTNRYEYTNTKLIMDKEIIFEAVYSKTRKFLLKCNSRYTSSIVGPSTRVKSAEHDKIFKTTSVTNLSAFSNNFLKSKINDTFLMTIIKFPFQNVISLTVILKIMYHLNPLKPSLTRLFQNKTSTAVKKPVMKSSKADFVT